MLEHPTLWLVPWSACPADCLPRRAAAHPAHWAVLDPATGNYLGLVRTHRPWMGSWLRWLSQPVVEVFESEDESFLLRTWRSWGGAWHVCDAEGRPAGTVRGTEMHGSQGQRIGGMMTAPDGQAGCWQSPEGRELGTFRSADGGTMIGFSPELLAQDPFVRMLLLATLLRID